MKRILKSGWEKFARDRSSTAAALVVMVVVLFVVSSLFVLRGVSSFLAATLEESVDVSAYFVDTATEEDISQVRQQLLGIEEVKAVDYVSKEEALKRFVETHQEDQIVLDSLEAVGGNPFLPALNIKAKDPSQYEKISEFLESAYFAPLIADVDYHDRAPVIERISIITSGIRASVLSVVILLALIAVLVAFNTIRLAIYNSKQEIEIMRLVGASNWFIRGPFLVQGILVGIAASILALILLFAASYFIAPELQSFTGFDLTDYIATEFPAILLLQFLVGIGLGVISSVIAIRAYLKV